MRVLSSPKISVLNNQTAVLKVVDNLVYFTIQAQSTTRTQTSALTTFTTTLNSVPVGFIMSLVPQISDTDTVVLNLRPTISRKIGDVADPNPSLAAAGVTSLIPVIQTREMESVLRVQSGQVAVLGGLMQDAVSNIEDTIPGRARHPRHRRSSSRSARTCNQKTELVIFLRPMVIRDASIDGDYAGYRGLLPGADFFSKPNPSRPRSAATPSTDMSLLLEALKKAEKAKEEAQRRARGEADDRRAAAEPARAEPAAQPVVTRDQLPDIRQPLALEDEPPPKPAPSRVAGDAPRREPTPGRSRKADAAGRRARQRRARYSRRSSGSRTRACRSTSPWARSACSPSARWSISGSSCARRRRW